MGEADDDRDPWYAEAQAMGDALGPRDFDVANAAELPHELSHHAIAADEDDDFDQQFDEWWDYLFDGDDQCLLLAIEQSCDEGVLLPWDMRAVRLQTLPDERLAQLHWIFNSCPRHVLVHVANAVYWLVRSERSRRRGHPHWSPSMALPSVPAYEIELSFKPIRSWPKHWP